MASLLFCVVIFFIIPTDSNTVGSSSSSNLKFNKSLQIENQEIDASENEFLIQDKHTLLEYKLQAGLPEYVIDETNKYWIKIERENLIEDSFEKLAEYKNDKTDPFVLKRKLKISFVREPALGTGLITEWFNIFSTKTFNPEYGLFKFSNSNSDIVEIDPLAKEKHNLYKFELLGLFTAMAIYHKELLNVNFSTPFLKAFLKKPVKLEDLEFTDPDYYRLFHKILKRNPKRMKLKFEVEHPRTKEMHYLEGPVEKPSKVTNDNKMQYVKLFIKWKYEQVIEDEMEAFRNGFQTLIPLNLLKEYIYDEKDLATIISGEKCIDVGKWRKSTGYIECDEKLRTWFWKIIENFDELMKSNLLQYVTGINRIPVSRSFYFTLNCSPLEDKNPRASTCYSILFIGNHYSSLKQMENILIALTKFPLKYSYKIE